MQPPGTRMRKLKSLHKSRENKVSIHGKPLRVCTDCKSRRLSDESWAWREEGSELHAQVRKVRKHVMQTNIDVASDLEKFSEMGDWKLQWLCLSKNPDALSINVIGFPKISNEKSSCIAKIAAELVGRATSTPKHFLQVLPYFFHSHNGISLTPI